MQPETYEENLLSLDATATGVTEAISLSRRTEADVSIVCDSHGKGASETEFVERSMIL